MLKKLRYKFTLICTFTTSTVLLITMMTLFFISKKQLMASTRHELDTHMNTLIYNIQNSYSHSTGQYSLSYSNLAQLENDNSLIIAISENQQPLHYKGSYPTVTDRQTLTKLALQTALNDYGFNPYTSNDLNSFLFELRPSEREHYLVNISSFSLNFSTMQIMLLKDLKNYDHSLRYQLLIYITVFLIATLLLCLFSYWFAGRVILPIAQNEKEQKAFIAAASHELRSPLAVLTTNTSALCTQYPMLENSSFYTSIKSECQRMSRLLDDLSLLSHADTQINWYLEPTLVEVDTLLINLHDTFYQLATTTGHTLKLELPDTLIPACLIDSQRLTQAITILLNNAISYTPKGSTITLSLSKPTNESLCILVIDDGPGIPDEHKPYIFKRFYRVDTARHTKEHFGLGLSIAYEIISLHKGKLVLEDTLPHGCTFKILLPIQL